jgi:hypothetical protein
MNHAVTIGGLLCVLGIIGGIIGAPVGLLMFIAGLQSDSTSGAASTSNKGMIIVAGSIAVLIFSIVKLF